VKDALSDSEVRKTISQQELEELGSVDDRVGDRRALDEALLGQFGAKVATVLSQFEYIYNCRTGLV
jgi:hypothetical protein